VVKVHYDMFGQRRRSVGVTGGPGQRQDLGQFGLIEMVGPLNQTAIVTRPQ